MNPDPCSPGRPVAVEPGSDAAEVRVVIQPLPSERDGIGGEESTDREKEDGAGGGASGNASPANEEERQRLQNSLLDPESSLDLHFRSFEMGDKLGEGGFGSVYRVKDRKTGAVMAMKVVLLEMTGTTTVEACAKAAEARTEVLRIKQLTHPNIVLGIDCTFARIPGKIKLETDSQENIRIYGPFALLIFTEMCSSSLKDFIKETERGLINKDGGKQLLGRFLFEITDALAFMHNQDVIHHDIKPDNILISDDLHIRITDFGISRHVNQHEEVFGTILFVPPEVMPGLPDEVDPPHPSSKDAFAMGVTAYLMLREAGGDKSTTYHSDTWFSIAGDKECMWEISEDDKEGLLAKELSHLLGSEAMRLVSGMLKMDWKQRKSIQNVRQKLLGFLRDPDELFAPSDDVAEDMNDGQLAPPVPPARIEFQPRHWLLSACAWVLRLTPLLLLIALVIWRFVVESDDEDVQKGQNEFRRMVAATTAAMVSSSVVASIISVGLVRMKQTVALRYFLIILVIISTFLLGLLYVNSDARIVGALFILYAISQFFTTWSVHTTDDFASLQDLSNTQSKYCNAKLLENLTRFELFGLITSTLLFQLGLLYAGITVVKGLPTDPWEVIFLAAICWLVNLPRYLAHFSLVRAMTNAVNLCQRLSYKTLLRQVLENINSILLWSLLAVQQPVWSVFETIAVSLIRAGQILIGCAVCASCCGDGRDDDGNCLSWILLCFGASLCYIGIHLLRLSSKLSIYCSKFYISMLAYDVVLGGGDNSCWALVARLRSYGAESDLSVKCLLFLANKSISSSNNANFCILLGCLSALIAAAIDEQAALYGYLAGYLACSTVLEMQSSTWHWFVAVLGSEDVVCPEMMNTMREALLIINDNFKRVEERLTRPGNNIERNGNATDNASAGNEPAGDSQTAPPEQGHSMPQAGAP